MFLPGFVTGRLIQRFGVHRDHLRRRRCSPCCCVAVNVAFAPAYADVHGRAGAAGRRLELHVRRRHDAADHAHMTPAERVRVQATNDFIVFGTVAVHRVHLGRDRGGRRLDRAEPDGGAAGRRCRGDDRLALGVECAGRLGIRLGLRCRRHQRCRCRLPCRPPSETRVKGLLTHLPVAFPRSKRSSRLWQILMRRSGTASASS